MFFTSVIYILLTIVLGSIFADDESKVTIKYLDSDEGTEGYDLFYFDGQSLRDEKWRFDPKTGSTVVSRRNGFREMDNFHLVDATLDALGSFTKSYKMRNEKDFAKHRVKEPQTNRDGDNSMSGSVRGSNAFAGVSINTQYSTQNGYPQLSNVVGIQQSNAPNAYNGLNFQHAFNTPGFGFQQQGSLFNHHGQFQTSNQSPFPNNQNFQLSSFLIPFFNQHNLSPNQQGMFPTFGVNGAEQINIPNTSQGIDSTEVPVTEQQITSSTIKPDAIQNNFPPQATEHGSTIGSTVNMETTVDPTRNFDIRLEEDKNEELDEASKNSTMKIPTTSRRPIEGLPTSDEDENIEGGVLDDKIGQQILKTLVG